MDPEVRDQLLHVLAGMIVTLALIRFVGVAHSTAFIVMMTIAEIRELYQHGWNPLKQGAGSFRDLSFFAVGGAAALLIAGA